MKQVTDTGAIEKIVDEIVAKNPDKVAEAKAKPQARRLVRRPGDEGLGRQGQPAGGERSAESKARALSQAFAADQRSRSQVSAIEQRRSEDLGCAGLRRARSVFAR